MPKQRIASYNHPTAFCRGTLTFRKAKLALDIKNRGARVFKGNVKVLGVYDDVAGVEYAHLGSTDGNTAIYINFSDSDLSNLEYRGQTYPLDCTE